MSLHIYKHDEIVRTLHLIQKAGFDNAIIAGGAVRDLYFDEMPRDIDIFVQAEVGCPNILHPEKGFNLIAKMMRLRFGVGYASDSVARVFDGSGKGMNGVTGILNVMKNYIPYQLVILNMDPVKFVEDRFDIGLCKAYCDGTKFRFTPDFMHDAQNKLMTICAKDMTQSEFDYTMNTHIPRIKHKFQGHKVVVSPWNEHLVANHTKV